MRAALFLVAVLILAGCVTPSSEVDALAGRAPQEILPHLELSDAHDHKDPAQHDVAWNMERIGWDPIAPDVSQLGRYNHVAVQGTRAFVTAYHLANNTPGGLAVFNISGDDPKLVGTLEREGLVPIDVHVSQDGKYAVIAGHADPRFAPPSAANACTGTPMLNVCTPFVPAGVQLIDVSDETKPTQVAGWRSAPSGAHTAKVVKQGDTYYVYLASYGLSYAGRLASHVQILEVRETPRGVELAPVSAFFASRMSSNEGAERVFVHDIFIADHPSVGALMYVSYWDGGVVLVDVNDPASPKEIAVWDDFDGVAYGNVHFARPVGMIGDRHVSYAAPEYGSAEHAGEAYVLDTTDPAAPKLLAKWALPGNPVNDGNYRFSPHNFDPLGTRVVYAHYHGGVWVLDLADPEAPAVLGYAFPTVPEGTPAFHAAEDAPNVWAAVWAQDGTIWASDIGTGLYHYRLVGDEPGTPPYEAVLE